MLHFYTPWKRQKTKRLLIFLGGIEMKHWANMGYRNIFFKKIPSKTKNKRLTLGI